MDTKNILLKAENLCYTYDGDSVPALDHLSLTIERGKKIACMGSNGSGKSTFFLCCNGIHKPSSGALYYNGIPFDYSKRGLLNLRKNIGIVFQIPDNQLFSASVIQEISFGVLNLGFPKEEAKKKVMRIMDKLGITPFAHKPVHALSGGQKKLVAIADILVMEPELIILDEPTSALDPLHTQIVRDIIDEITREGITVLTATHDVNYAYTWADEILLFHKGSILKQGTPEEVFTDEGLMETTCLQPPMVLSLFQNLCKDGILPDTLTPPKDLDTLRNYLTIQNRSEHLLLRP
jgi:cobalt/nickel transport system ATP-binding protein